MQDAADQSEYIKTIVTKPHHATDHTQIELKVNDIVYVLEQDETGWGGGFKEGEDQTGWFPGSCVRPVPVEIGAQQVAPQEHVQPAQQHDVYEGKSYQNGAADVDGAHMQGSRPVASPMRGGHSAYVAEAAMDAGSVAWSSAST